MVALTANRAFEQFRDAPRFRKAFESLFSSKRRWPAPVDFLEAMPRLTASEVKEIRLTSDSHSLVAARSIAEISKFLDIRPDA